MAKNAAERRGQAQIGSDRQLHLKVAFIGAVAALVGSLGGGLITYFISSHEEIANRKEDRRIERRDAYAQYYKDVAALAGQIGLKSDLIGAKPGSSIDSATLKRIRDDLDSRRLKLHEDQAMVVLFGSKEVSDVGFNLASRVNDLETVVSTGQATPELLRSSIKATADGLDAFHAAAITDLNS